MISLPAGVFRPYAVVSTAIIVFTKTGRGGTDHVWYYDLQADGMSLDDKQTPLREEGLIGPVPACPLSEGEYAKNNLADLLARWNELTGSEYQRRRTAQSFYVPKADIVAAGYDLSLNRYKEVVHAEVKHDSPKDIIKELRHLEQEIAKGLTALGGMLT